MISLGILVLLGIHRAAAVSHTLQYFYTASTGMETFPEFVAVGIVDGQQIDYYDSVSQENVLKQTWMEGVRDENNIRDTRRGAQQSFKANVGVAMQRFNQTIGSHIVQKMYGCEWDDETEQVTGYRQHGYDGEDFLVWNTKTNTWIAPKRQAELTQNKWNNDRAELEYRKNYLEQLCPEWLKKYVNYGRSSLMRTELPSVSFLQKTPSSPITCHATGFYPNRAELFWRKDGEEVHEGVVKGEILPNIDGSFQMSVDLDLSSVGTADWKYECVFQLSGAQDVFHPLDKTKIRTNYPNSYLWIIAIIAAVVVTAGVGFILYKKKECFQSCSQSSKSSQSSDDTADSGENMLPKQASNPLHN